MRLSQLRERVFSINVANKWHDEKRDFHDDINLIHSEISEAYEDYRNNKEVNEIWYEYGRGGEFVSYSKTLYENEFIMGGDKNKKVLGKPCGIPSELADIVIRILDTDKLHGLGVAEVVLNYNFTHYKDFTFSQWVSELHWLTSYVKMNYEEKRMGLVRENLVRESLRIIIAHCASIAALNQFDLHEVIEEKLAYNATRGPRHGGKLI